MNLEERVIKAEEYFKRALYIKETEKTRYLLARVYIDSNQMEKAKEELELLRKNFPQNIEYTICLANIFISSSFSI